MLSLSAVIFGIIFLILLIILLTRRPVQTGPIERKELKAIKKQINGEEF